MRIADKMNYDQVKSNISKNRTEMADLQNQAASQKRVNKPSDDPLAATRVLQPRTEIGSGQQFLKSVSQAKTFLEYSDQAIGELTEIINRAKELALGQANDPTSNPTARSAVSQEIDQKLHDAAGQHFLFQSVDGYSLMLGLFFQKICELGRVGDFCELDDFSTREFSDDT